MITILATVIAPYATPIDSLFFGLIFLGLISAGLAFMLSTKRLLAQNRMRGLLSMLAGFVGLVSFSAVIFTLAHARSIQPIVFEKDAVKVGSHLLKYRNIENSYIKPLMQKSRYSSQLNTDTALIYVIEMRDGKSHLLSNDNYDLKAIDGALEARR